MFSGKTAFSVLGNIYLEVIQQIELGGEVEANFI